jgi:PhnB protein
MSVSIHLTFAGQCEAAFRFYQRCFEGTFETSVALTRYRDTPAPAPDDWRDKIVHGHLMIAGTMLAGADVQPSEYTPPKGFSVLLDVAGIATAERIFAALAERGTIAMPIQQTFWAPRFGVLVDQFGIPWEINCAG